MVLYIYSIASCDFFVNTPLCNVINQQQLKWATHVVPWLAHASMLKHRSYYSMRLLTALAHTKWNTHTAF